MKLGIMSDSHGRAARVRKALQQLDALGAEAFVHCGDVGGLEVIDELAGRRCWFVWGNTDDPDPRWRQYVQSVGLTWPTGPLRLELAGKQIAVFHGHEREFHEALEAAECGYLLHGHTHKPADYRVGNMRVVNPGALHRALPRTVALLDLTTDRLEFLEI